ncbi:kinase-like domain-containing protein [Apodospora peruviana]|uniref:non-specific serine/threonine protein kinase n=1 Tax=Apodospora peruviana TaxID=516989 RepID=A0AAE0MH53_9PEZI|nr:kinase-like domain-containing protein [Apodospora peruviana]
MSSTEEPPMADSSAQETQAPSVLELEGERGEADTSTMTEQDNENRINEPEVIEEGKDAYRPGKFHPVYIGDVYNDRYKILNKIGYGSYSTVWLVRDLQKPPGDETEFRALKILSADCYGTDHDTFEREILVHLRNGGKEFLGYKYICHLLDDFSLQGPNGTHVCLVFELMGESLRTFGTLFPDDRLPNDVMRRFTIQLLLALDFAHDYNVIHTDIQPGNIFVKIRDHSLIESKYLAEVPIPQQDRDEKEYTVIPSRPLQKYYFVSGDRADEFDITLGDWGVSSWVDKHLSENIQPVLLRAPEVLIRAPWDKSTDIWNLGAVILEIFRAVRMFDGRVPPDGYYELKEHLAEIVDLFGPFPASLLEKSRDKELVDKYFDADGRIKDEPLEGRAQFGWEAYTPGLREDVREKFVSFLNATMKVDPAERPSPEDLLRHPWLGALPPKEAI